MAVIVVRAARARLPVPLITWGGTDARALPAAAALRLVSEALASDFPANATTPIEAVVKFAGPADAPARQAALVSYLTRLRHVPGVVAGQVTGVAGNVARVDLRYAANPGVRGGAGTGGAGRARCRR